MRSNCLIWAVGEIWRRMRRLRALPRDERGGLGIGLWCEWSLYGWWPHFAVIDKAEDEDCRSFNPVVKKRRRRWWELPVVFRGEVRKGKR